MTVPGCLRTTAPRLPHLGCSAPLNHAGLRSFLDEVLGFRPNFIEHQLVHAVRDPLGHAYNRTAHLPERRKMMQDWADYLDNLKDNSLRTGK